MNISVGQEPTYSNKIEEIAGKFREWTLRIHQIGAIVAIIHVLQ